MKRLYKEIVCLFFVLVMMFSLCTTTFFASETLGVVNGSVINTYSTAGNADLADIQLDVYALIPVFSDSNQTDYDKQFAFSVSTDANGEYSFTKPSAICVVEINEDTVADGYGVLTGVDIISADETTSELKISALATYEIDLEDNSLQFYNAQDERLTVKENLNYENVSLFDLKLKNNIMTAQDNQAVMYATPYRPTIPNMTTYTEGDFTFFYESGMVSNTQLRILYSQFNFAKTALCSTYHFREPNYPAGSSTYEVYLINELANNKGINGRVSGAMYDWYIEIDMDHALSGRATPTISHEFMHAVQLAYTYRTSYDFKAFNEGVAELASYVCTDSIHSQWMNQFQNSPELSLFDNGSPENPYDNSNSGPYAYREYGSVLFSLYIYENFLGLTTIRQIYEEYAETNDIYLALDNTLKELYNTTLIENYLAFRVAVYEPYNNYETTLPVGLISPKKTSITENVITYTTPMLSTMYFEFEAEVEDYYTFCFALQGTTDKNQVNLTGIYTSPDGEQTITEYSFNSKLKMPNVDMEEGSKICFLMSNINLTDTDIQFYTCTI